MEEGTRKDADWLKEGGGNPERREGRSWTRRESCRGGRSGSGDVIVGQQFASDFAKYSISGTVAQHPDDSGLSECAAR